MLKNNWEAESDLMVQVKCMMMTITVCREIAIRHRLTEIRTTLLDRDGFKMKNLYRQEGMRLRQYRKKVQEFNVAHGAATILPMAVDTRSKRQRSAKKMISQDDSSNIPPMNCIRGKKVVEGIDSRNKC